MNHILFLSKLMVVNLIICSSISASAVNDEETQLTAHLCKNHETGACIVLECLDRQKRGLYCMRISFGVRGAGNDLSGAPCSIEETIVHPGQISVHYFNFDPDRYVLNHDDLSTFGYLDISGITFQQPVAYDKNKYHEWISRSLAIFEMPKPDRGKSHVNRIKDALRGFLVKEEGAKRTYTTPNYFISGYSNYGGALNCISFSLNFLNNLGVIFPDEAVTLNTALNFHSATNTGTSLNIGVCGSTLAGIAFGVYQVGVTAADFSVPGSGLLLRLFGGYMMGGVASMATSMCAAKVVDKSAQFIYQAEAVQLKSVLNEIYQMRYVLGNNVKRFIPKFKSTFTVVSLETGKGKSCVSFENTNLYKLLSTENYNTVTYAHKKHLKKLDIPEDGARKLTHARNCCFDGSVLTDCCFNGSVLGRSLSSEEK